MTPFSTTLTKESTDQGGDTAAATVGIHPDIIQVHILTRLDGPSLASTSCTSSQLNNLCCDENLWKNICNTSWPSTTDPLLHDTISTFPSGHRSFFSDASSVVHHPLSSSSQTADSYLYRTSNISRLISAIDIHFEDKSIFSRVIDTETVTDLFLYSPFRIDLLELEEAAVTAVKLGGDDSACTERLKDCMRLSWILIDPNTKRALNLSSIRPVAVRRYWLAGQFQAIYEMVMFGGGGCVGLVQCWVVVTCGDKVGRELKVREVSMLMEDMEGLLLNGKPSLVILQDSMEEKRVMRKSGEDKERYDMFVKLKRDQWDENEKPKISNEGLEMVWIAIGIMMVFMAFWTTMFLS